MKISDKEQIKSLLPHRDPLLLADSAETGTDGASMTTSFHADPDMDIFKGHFPDDPILPGVYVIEAMAQCAGLLMLTSDAGSKLKPYLVSVERMRFIRPIRPNDTLICHAALDSKEEDFYVFNVSAELNSQTAAKGVLTLTFR